MTRKSLAAIVAALVVAFGVSAAAQTGYETALAAYRRAVIALESHRGSASVEQVFNRGLLVREALLKADSRGVTALETISSEDFDALKRQFGGFLLAREEAIYANPDPDYFATLARTYGDTGDRAFFDAYRRTRPAGVWPVWVEQQTDASGCTKFGAGHLVSTYRLWNEFRRNYSRRYREEVEGFVGAVEYEVSASTCACGDAAAVLSELEEFDRAFPESRVSNAVKLRIRQVREDRSPIRFGCSSGPASRIVR